MKKGLIDVTAIATAIAVMLIVFGILWAIQYFTQKAAEPSIVLGLAIFFRRNKICCR